MNFTELSRLLEALHTEESLAGFADGGDTRSLPMPPDLAGDPNGQAKAIDCPGGVESRDGPVVAHGRGLEAGRSLESPTDWATAT